jgi:hypothetical protein
LNTSPFLKEQSIRDARFIAVRFPPLGGVLLTEPRAVFASYRGDDWPTTTLPAFEAAGCHEAIRELFERALASHGIGAVEATA